MDGNGFKLFSFNNIFVGILIFCIKLLLAFFAEEIISALHNALYVLVCQWYVFDDLYRSPEVLLSDLWQRCLKHFDTMSANIFADIQSPFPPAGSPSGEAPPPYSTLPSDQSEAGFLAWGSPSVSSVASYGQPSMKLSYMDFIPQVIKKRLIGKDEYEKFRCANIYIRILCLLVLKGCALNTCLAQLDSHL